MNTNPASEHAADLDEIFAPSPNAPVLSPDPAPVTEPTPSAPDADGGTGPSGGAGKDTKKRRSTSAPVLGIYVTPTNVHGILVRESGDSYGVLRPFARQRNAFAVSVPDLAATTPEAEMEPGADDVTIQFGDSVSGMGGSDLFLDSEFSDLAGTDAPEMDFQTQQRRTTSPVVFELKDIIDECRAAGHDRPPTSFCLTQPDVDYVEIVVSDKNDKGKKGKKEPSEAAQGEVKRDRLLARLAEEVDTVFEKERVAFLPMTPREGLQRFLAVVPTQEETLAESLDLLREQSGMRAVPFRSVDAEVPLLVGLARWAFPSEPQENTAIVRVGTEDTLVILLQGDTLHHTEHMLSVTTFDGPDTICSRVLLQQDVQGIGTVHHVVVLSEEREAELVQGFGAFYPDARVGALREGLIARGVIPPGGESTLSAPALPALGVALRTLMDRDKASPFYDEINMLPKRLRRRRRKIDLSVAWHTILAGVLVFFTVLFFIGSYFSQQREIAEAQQRVDAYPEELNMSGPALQAQIDSLQGVYLQITRTLNTIDSLLVGSDKWSRSLARTSRATASSGGTWVATWNPQPNGVKLEGVATSRSQVVQFAERMEASIENLTFSEIRDFPVYDFRLNVPIREELPEVAKYLREQVDTSEMDPRPIELEDPLVEYGTEARAERAEGRPQGAPNEDALDEDAPSDN